MKKKTLSADHKRKISESMKSTKNHAWGKPLTSEHRHKIRLSMIKFHQNKRKGCQSLY